MIATSRIACLPPFPLSGSPNSGREELELDNRTVAWLERVALMSSRHCSWEKVA